MSFLLLDRIVSLEPGLSIVAQRRIAPDEAYFADHFPGFPVVPGVLLTEMMGQAAAKCLIAHPAVSGKPMLARIQDATFRQWVRPTQVLELRATITARQARFANADCEARVDGAVAASARLMFAFANVDQFEANPRDTVLERYFAEHPS